jgi:pyrroline-5-carboxylate reductase
MVRDMAFSLPGNSDDFAAGVSQNPIFVASRVDPGGLRDVALRQPEETMLSAGIGLIGAGQMARALAAGFVRAGLIKPQQIVASDPIAAACDAFLAQVPGARIAVDNAAVAAAADVLLLAVKPQQMQSVLAELRDRIATRHLIVSIAAGIRIARIDEGLADPARKEPLRIIRVMPNTPCLVGESASAYCGGPGATDADFKRIDELLSSVGKAFRVEEKQLDAVTGLSGSGPAFIYVLIEALSDGGVRMGLSRELASALAAQTVLGSAQMVLTTGEHPAVLKDRVASPGGTTIAGLQALESAGFRSALIAAVEAATRRSIELAN